MNPNETRTLWISIAAGIFAAFLLYSYSQEKKAEYDRRYGSSSPVVVAARDIRAMETIDATMLQTVQRPVDFIEPKAITNPELAIGQVAGTPIAKDQQVIQNNLLDPGPDTGIANQVAPNKRAVTIPTDEIRGVAKLIRPGDRVDIIAAVDVGRGQDQRREVQTLLQDVVVLATGIKVVNNIPRVLQSDPGSNQAFFVPLQDDSRYNTITIEADPKQAQDLIYILSTAPGNIFFTLRNPNDRNLTRLPTSTNDTVVRQTASDPTPRSRAPQLRGR